MIKIYKKHLFGVFTKSVLEISGIFFSLIFILGFFEEVNFFRDTDVGIFQIMFLTVLNAPSLFFEIFPFIFLIATQLFFYKIIYWR